MPDHQRHDGARRGGDRGGIKRPALRFLLFLSVTLGIPFSELGQRISAAELTLYQVYYRHHPWGSEHAEILNAMQMAQTANMHRGKGQPAYKLDDFMPFREKPEADDEVTHQTWKQAFQSMVKRSK